AWSMGKCEFMCKDGPQTAGWLHVQSIEQKKWILALIEQKMCQKVGQDVPKRGTRRDGDFIPAGCRKKSE
ncbi:MAG: hypothetical protein OEU26_12575, partial [Candidatus Tectomicrobia bacterium]|nr:hypothetical protein [Candidatus Tectomicrobia bacterium]